MRAPLGGVLTQPKAVVTPNQTFSGKQLTSLSTANCLTAAGTTAPTIGQNQTLVALFYWVPGAPVAHIATLWKAFANAAGLVGWILQWSNVSQSGGPANNLYFSMLNGATSQSVVLGVPVQGINAVAITRTAANHIRTSLNGAAIVDTALTLTPSNPAAGSTHSIGQGYTGANGWDANGGVFHLVGLNRLASDAELVAWSLTPYPTTPQSRYNLPASLTGDAAVTFDWLASRDWNGVAGTSTSHGSSPVTFTVVGAPTLPAISEVHVSDLSGTALADKYVSLAQRSQIDGAAYWQSNCYDRIRSPTAQPQIGLEYENTENPATALASVLNSERAAVYVTGAWVADLPTTTPVARTKTLVWLQLAAFNAAVPTGEIDIWQPAVEDPTVSGAGRVGGYLVGATLPQAPTNPVANESFTIYGDSVSVSYFANTGGGAWAARTRAAFPTAGGPGQVIVEAYGGRSLYVDTWGGLATQIAAFGAKLLAECQQVAGTKYLVCWIGYNDSVRIGTTWVSAAAFKAAYQAVINFVHAADPSILISVLNLPQAGAGPAALNAQIATMINCTLIDTTGWGITFVDGVHPDAASQITIFNNIKAAIGY